jgi:hypothetical protein
MMSEENFATGSEEEDDYSESYSSEGSGSEYVDGEDSQERQDMEEENGEPDTAEKEIENDFECVFSLFLHSSPS